LPDNVASYFWIEQWILADGKNNIAKLKKHFQVDCKWILKNKNNSRCKRKADQLKVYIFKTDIYVNLSYDLSWGNRLFNILTVAADHILGGKPSHGKGGGIMYTFVPKKNYDFELEGKLMDKGLVGQDGNEDDLDMMEREQQDDMSKDSSASTDSQAGSQDHTDQAEESDYDKNGHSENGSKRTGGSKGSKTKKNSKVELFINSIYSRRREIVIKRLIGETLIPMVYPLSMAKQNPRLFEEVATVIYNGWVLHEQDETRERDPHGKDKGQVNKKGGLEGGDKLADEKETKEKVAHEERLEKKVQLGHWRDSIKYYM
jgi:hypothetical protein